MVQEFVKDTEVKYSYNTSGRVIKSRRKVMSNFRPYVKTIEYNTNGTMSSIEISEEDGAPRTKKVFIYKETNPYTVYGAITETYKDGHCIQRRTTMLDTDTKVPDCVKEKNEFFSVRVGKRCKDFTCEDYYVNAYIDKFGDVRDCRTKLLVFK